MHGVCMLYMYCMQYTYMKLSAAAMHARFLIVHAMKIHSTFLSYFRLDKSYSYLNCRDVFVLLEFFKAMDVREIMALDDVQFLAFMQRTTDLSKRKIYRIFDMLDVEHAGLLNFDEFYILICIMLAVRDNEEKDFILRHSQTVFEFLDEDGNGTITVEEFEALSFLFNFEGTAMRQIFKEFDVCDDQELDYQEFKMFTVACIDRQVQMEKDMHGKRWYSNMTFEARKEWCGVQ